MKYLTYEIRQAFLDYFRQHEHVVVPSSSLLPANDPTLLFTNAGMVQFKDVFLGKETRQSGRVVTAQRCMRAGGKHNDLENVGYTTRHHTFFEMLGNFSFGDYFKREAIHYAWEFLTKRLGVAPQKLWITVHEKDKEAEKLWQAEFQRSGARAQGLSYCGDTDNFWAMGETGPCGYCSEIFYDHGEKFAGDPPGGELEGERYVEIWNLVFMQFERDIQGNLTALPKPAIDTGMGLERIAAVMQGTHDNYAIDIFTEVYGEFASFLEEKFAINAQVLQSAEAKTAARVVADHIRAAMFLIAEGVMPGNERAGYVLRSIIRRAVYYLYRLGVRQPVFFQFVYPLLRAAKDVYVELELAKQQQQIVSVIEQEEIKFLDTLDRGLRILTQEIAQLKQPKIPGAIIFNLHDTYGLPAILTTEIARQRGLAVDQAGFTAAMEKQRANSRAASKFSANEFKLQLAGATEFFGYNQDSCSCKIIGLCGKDGSLLESLAANAEGIIILDSTTFYAEAGGQVGDSGEIYADCGVFQVQDTQKYGDLHLHHGVMLKGTLAIEDTVTAAINNKRRQAIKLNHSATHLVHSGLRLVLGPHAIQRGSLVDHAKLRFDFTHPAALTKEELHELELVVNEQIRANLAVQTAIKSFAAAKREDILALFGEKYGDEVRVVSMGGFSKELCGGTHVDATGEIGSCKIVAEIGIAAGIRRIEAVTGTAVLVWAQTVEAELKNVSQVLEVGPTKIFSKIQEVLAEKHLQEKELTELKNKIAISKTPDLVAQAVELGPAKVLVTTLVDVTSKTLRQTVDALKQQLSSAVVVLATVQDNKAQLVVGVTQDLLAKVKANELLQYVAKQIDGSGGGRPDLAQGGGTKVAALQQALASVIPWVKTKI